MRAEAGIFAFWPFPVESRCNFHPIPPCSCGDGNPFDPSDSRIKRKWLSLSRARACTKRHVPGALLGWPKQKMANLRSNGERPKAPKARLRCLPAGKLRLEMFYVLSRLSWAFSLPLSLSPSLPVSLSLSYCHRLFPWDIGGTSKNFRKERARATLARFSPFAIHALETRWFLRPEPRREQRSLLRS